MRGRIFPCWWEIANLTMKYWMIVEMQTVYWGFRIARCRGRDYLPHSGFFCKALNCGVVQFWWCIFWYFLAKHLLFGTNVHVTRFLNVNSQLLFFAQSFTFASFSCSWGFFWAFLFRSGDVGRISQVLYKTLSIQQKQIATHSNTYKTDLKRLWNTIFNSIFR